MAEVDMQIGEYYCQMFKGKEPPQLDNEIKKVYAQQQMMEILIALHNVKTLELSTWFVEVNLDSKELQGDWEAIVSLQLVLYHLKFGKIQDVHRRLNELKFLKGLLKNCIVLEKVLVQTSKERSRNTNS